MEKTEVYPDCLEEWCDYFETDNLLDCSCFLKDFFGNSVRRDRPWRENFSLFVEEMAGYVSYKPDTYLMDYNSELIDAFSEITGYRQSDTDFLHNLYKSIRGL